MIFFYETLYNHFFKKRQNFHSVVTDAFVGLQTTSHLAFNLPPLPCLSSNFQGCFVGEQWLVSVMKN